MSAANSRLRRSVLYVPGSNSRALARAATLPADCIILDLEDAVAPEAKSDARERVAAAIETGGFGHREVIARVNGMDTPWGLADLQRLVQAGADAILLPKVGDADAVNAAQSALAAAGGPPEQAIWIMTETPRGVLALDDILAAHPRINVVVMGTSDLSRELRLRQDTARSGLMQALSHCLLTARAHGVDIIDGVHLALDDDAGFQAVCEQGRAMGFDGKSLIHPCQIAPANLCFGVTEAEFAAAREIVAAWDAARRAGQGLTVVRGKLVEQLHVDEARRLIELHTAHMRHDENNIGTA